LRAMFSGRFGNTSGRPYLEALVILPRLKVRSGVSFIVDTGADMTVLMPADAIKMGVNYKKLRPGKKLTGVGGNCKSFSEKAILVLSDGDRKIVFAYDIDMQIVDTQAAITKSGYCPSLLGRNVLDRLRISYDAQKRKIRFSLISADLIIPLKERAARDLHKELRSSITERELPHYPD